MNRRWLARLALLVIGIALLASALGVFIFQRLEVSDQDRVIRYLPFLAPLRATEIPFSLPTPLATASLDVFSLLTPEAPLPTPTPTPISSAFVRVAYQITATPAFFPTPLPTSYRIRGVQWEPQKFNNCGPANLVQAMRFYGWTATQDEVANALKPNQQDKNVSPQELADYVNSRTNGYLRAIVRTGGDLTLVRRLVAHEFMVLLETGFYDPDAPQKGWIGHYLTVIGYNDNFGRLYNMDTYKNETSERYDVLDELWSHFNRVYIVVYRAARERELMALLGDHWDEDFNRRYTLDRAREAAAAQPNNPFAWFNLGSSFTALGRYLEAALAFDRAFSLPQALPYRILWYQFAPFEAYYRSGNYQQVIALADSVIESAKSYVEEAFYYRGIARAALGLWDEGYADIAAAVRFNPNFSAAVRAMNSVRGRELP